MELDACFKYLRFKFKFSFLFRSFRTFRGQLQFDGNHFSISNKVNKTIRSKSSCSDVLQSRRTPFLQNIFGRLLLQVENLHLSFDLSIKRTHEPERHKMTCWFHRVIADIVFRYNFNQVSQVRLSIFLIIGFLYLIWVFQNAWIS